MIINNNPTKEAKAPTHTHSPLVTINEVVESLGGRPSRSTIYRSTRDGSIPSRRIGRTIFIPRAWVDSLLNGWQQTEVAA
jgi:excisionase family DNA binding protein